MTTAGTRLLTADDRGSTTVASAVRSAFRYEGRILGFELMSFVAPATGNTCWLGLRCLAGA